jgi:hypothetical protein
LNKKLDFKLFAELIISIFGGFDNYILPGGAAVIVCIK